MSEDAARAGRIRGLNDRFRKEGVGNGRIMMTAGVAELGPEFVEAVLAAVQGFDDFNADNDPWGEHDFGCVAVLGEKVFFKFDYYDIALRDHSPDAADDGVTRRVLTIMLAGEY